MSTKHPTYWALLPNSKEQLIDTALYNLKIFPFDPNAKDNFDYIHSCLELDHSKLIAHHVTLFFNKNKNKDIVKEDDVLYVEFKTLGWSPTNVVFFGDVKRSPDEASINLLLENTDRTHLTFSCNKNQGGKAVDSGKIIPHIELKEPIIISGVVHELYTENSNKVHGGDPPMVPEKKVSQKQKEPKTLSPQQIFKTKLLEANIPVTPELMRDFSMHCQLHNPSNNEIDVYIENLH
jgi:hypothetical protein